MLEKIEKSKKKKDPFHEENLKRIAYGGPKFGFPMFILEDSDTL